MQKQILNSQQEKLIDFLRLFSPQFGLIGGTAIALHIGHRRSIDFDLISLKEIDKLAINRKIVKAGKVVEYVLINNTGEEYTISIDKTRISFIYYPFPVELKEEFEGIKIPDLLTLSALKAYTLGRRAKWKDYVDLYFILRDYYKLEDVIKKTEEIFKDNFNRKIFVSQLLYFEDINYDDHPEYMPGFEVNDDEVKRFLKEVSLNYVVH